MPSSRDDTPEGAPFATVLVVDDEKQVTDGLSLLLRSFSFVPLAAQSGAEALAILRRRNVDVVVSDERMPGMSGSEFLSTVAREFPDTARVILTGHSTIDSAIRAINEGQVCRYLQKPCKPDEFRRAITEAHCASQRAHRASAVMRADGLPEEAIAALSEREREVFSLVIDGLRVPQIAKSLFISRHTVRNHLKALFSKLDVHSQAELLDKGRGRVK